MNECGRCHHQARDPEVRSTIANLEREARQDGTPSPRVPFAIEFRCRDKDACTARVNQHGGTVA